MRLVAGVMGLGLMGLGLMAGCRQAGPPVSERTRPEARQDAAREQGNAEDGYGGEREGRRRSRHGKPGRGRAEAEAAPGQFDFYLLNLSWSPEYCATHATSPECGRRLGFVMHGLWPQDFTGDYPEDCSDAPGPTEAGVYPTLTLAEHEWKAHGTCSGLSAAGYLQAVKTAFGEVRLPALKTGSVTPEALVRQMQGANPGFPAGSFAVSCGNNRLTAVEVCLDKGLKPMACQGVRSCRANVVGVTGQ